MWISVQKWRMEMAEAWDQSWKSGEGLRTPPTDQNGVKQLEAYSYVDKMLGKPESLLQKTPVVGTNCVDLDGHPSGGSVPSNLHGRKIL